MSANQQRTTARAPSSPWYAAENTFPACFSWCLSGCIRFGGQAAAGIGAAAHWSTFCCQTPSFEAIPAAAGLGSSVLLATTALSGGGGEAAGGEAATGAGFVLLTSATGAAGAGLAGAAAAGKAGAGGAGTAACMQSVSSPHGARAYAEQKASVPPPGLARARLAAPCGRQT
jgi:hypothetical protein